MKYYQNEEEQNYECKSYIGGSRTSNRYTKVNLVGIDMIKLYQDNGLTDNPNVVFISGTTVDLYARNYDEIEDQCSDKFLKDFEDEKKYFDTAFKISRIMSLIGLILILALFIYTITTCSCCCNVKFYGIAIVVPIYGLALNIIILSITNKAKMKYECQSEDYNSDLNDEIDEQYGNNTIHIVMPILNIVFFAFVLMFTLCLKFMRNQGIITTASIATPVVPVYPGAYPAPSYVSPYGQKIPYQNVIPGSY